MKLHYGRVSETEFFGRYSNFYGVAKLFITSQMMWNRIKNYNKGKTYSERIKPFGFIIVGFGMKIKNNKAIKPISPYQENPQKLVHLPFIDVESGNKLQGIEYWKPLSEIIYDYINHPESKLDGSIGILSRKKAHITDVAYIGKEASNLEYTGTLTKLNYDMYINNLNIRKRLQKMSYTEAKSLRIPKSTLHGIKQNIKQGKDIRLRMKTLIKLSVGAF